jgi:DNA-binding CsgD family transcriptional regulator
MQLVVQAGLYEVVPRIEPHNEVAELTDRELDVLRLIAASPMRRSARSSTSPTAP